MTTSNNSNTTTGTGTTTNELNYLSNINIQIFSPQKRIKLKHIDQSKKQDTDETINSNAAFFSKKLVIPGQVISREGEYLKGHGTFHNRSHLVASVCGTLEKVDKLVSVKAVKARYQGEVGDIIVGRITEIASKRWKVDVNSRQDYILMLSAINLPGGIQRRRTSSDELQMRTFFVENDLVYAEVQMLMGDGSVAIHTRNQKYGKLQNGHFMSVVPSLMKRSKQHYYSLDCGVDVILGLNGYIWVADTEQQRKQVAYIQQKEKDSFDSTIVIPEEIKQITKESSERISRVVNSIALLEKGFISIHHKSIMQVYKTSIKMNLSSKDLLHPDYIKQILTVLSLSNANDDFEDDQDDDDINNNNNNNNNNNKESMMMM
ncbi:hypothetical protein CYY_010316 [Polysphondylium violaceum]|uniref:Ribosomal RNA-processing protein 4 n=1 Tax=Polysphondylium violaceum TaxID=133409 RepID=A0A8J4UNT1_9MYCE|nr:hypothetical protein CYY_010316 [Polysphondylium violaceum]